MIIYGVVAVGRDLYDDCELENNHKIEWADTTNVKQQTSTITTSSNTEKDTDCDGCLRGVRLHVHLLPSFRISKRGG